MSGNHWTRRLVAGAGAGVLAASAVATLGAGAANAAVFDTVTGSGGGLVNGSLQWTRTVSDADPEVGSTITVTNDFTRKASVAVYLHAAQNTTSDNCLAYVPGSSKVVQHNSDDSTTELTDYVENGGYIDQGGVGAGGGWQLTDQPITWTASYKVNCDPGEQLIGLDFLDSSRLYESYKYVDTGSFGIDVQQVATEAKIGVDPQPQVGQTSTITVDVSAANQDAQISDGTVTFYNNGVAMGDPVQVVNGRATVAWTPDADGDYEISAEYSGHGNFAAATSEVLKFSIGETPGPEEPGTGSLGSLTGSLGSLGSLGR